MTRAIQPHRNENVAGEAAANLPGELQLARSAGE
jgi:hypothetical protein